MEHQRTASYENKCCSLLLLSGSLRLCVLCMLHKALRSGRKSTSKSREADRRPMLVAAAAGAAAAAAAAAAIGEHCSLHDLCSACWVLQKFCRCSKCFFIKHENPIFLSYLFVPDYAHAGRLSIMIICPTEIPDTQKYYAQTLYCCCSC